ncbi:MAG: hypothetical protein GF315_08660 [candidate division Zixibacteria bacterium]|nr:hypothetical protein [candidate division Zixibacteria bacterium]
MQITYRNEVYRKLIHLGSLSMPIGYHLFGKIPSIIIISFALLVSLYIDLSRIYSLPGKQFLINLIGPVLREHEFERLGGAFYILLAGLIAIIFLDVPTAAAAMGFVIVGDVAAALTGRRWGETRLPGTRKSLEGSIGCLLACILVAYVAPGVPFIVGLAGAVVATIAEAYSGVIDDNIAVVIASGLVMYLAG